MSYITRYKRSYDIKINEEIKDLINRCNKSEPLARYIHKNVFKCFVREYMQKCLCNELCVLKLFYKVNLEELCDEWDINKVYIDDRYLGCNVPVVVNDNLYKKYTWNDLRYEKTFFKIPREEINERYKFESNNFIESCHKKDLLKTIRYFDTMRCVVLDIREYCQKDKNCESDFFNYNMFNEECIPKLYIDRFVPVSINNTKKVIWKFTQDISKIYFSDVVEEIDILNIKELPVQELTPYPNETDFLYPNVSSDITPKINDITTESPVNIPDHFYTTSEFPLIINNTTSRPLDLGSIRDVYLFDISICILFFIGLILQNILAMSSYGTRLSKILLVLICIILLGMIVLGIIKFN